MGAQAVVWNVQRVLATVVSHEIAHFPQLAPHFAKRPQLLAVRLDFILPRVLVELLSLSVKFLPVVASVHVFLSHHKTKHRASSVIHIA